MSIDVLALRLNAERNAALAAAGYTVRAISQYPSREAAMRDAGENVRAVLTNGRGGLTAAEMALLPKLELIVTVGAGYEAVDVAEARKRGIAVAHSPGTNATAVADSAMMLLLASVRHIRAADRHVQAGQWQDQWRVNTQILFGKKLGLIGLGNIGGGIANRAARGFDMQVGYFTRNAVAGSPYRHFKNLIDLARWADYLVSAAPGGAATRHLINAEVLAALGPKGYVVNVGRGTAVDTQALLDALREKRIAGAGLDVLEGEPALPPLLPELLKFDNVVITPHCAARAPESTLAATELIINNLNAHFAGKPLLTPVPFKG
ncbi:MAG: 2-hydroxyacid dehydrogenase [Betaproteobacteria bacterium]|nr:2-hydroxyacid dehydrogenase [Betaproteobacteria bacterium]